jgi:hypothetical protein
VLSGKASSSNVYTKTDINNSITTLNNSINLKSNILTTYNKTEVDNLIGNVNGSNGTFNNTWSNSNGSINLNGSLGNYIYYNIRGLGSPTISTRSYGTKLVIYPSLSATSVDYAIGMDDDALWYSSSLPGTKHRWYCGTIVSMTLNANILTLPAALSVGTSISTNTLTATGNISSSGNINNNSTWSNTAGSINLNSTGTGNYILWNTIGTNPPINGRSTGTKVCLYPGAASQPDYAIGIDALGGIGALWFSVSSIAAVHRWYCGTNKVMELSNTSLTLPAALSVGTNLSVYGTSLFSNKLKIQCAGGGGSIRVVPNIDNTESSIGFYNYTDMRETIPNSVNNGGAMWVVGQNCWGREEFSIGSAGLDSCIHINNVGDVNIPVALLTPIIDTTLITCVMVRIRDNIETLGTVYSYVNVIYLTNNTVLTFDNIKNGLITCLNTASGLSLTLPTGAAIHTGMPTLGFNQSFQWSVMNLSSSTGNIIMLSSADHAYIGNATLTPNASYRFLTVLTAADTAKTYRICN